VAGGSGGAAGRNETAAERLDRNYGELLQELRVAQVGVQILFASLLTVVFSQRFTTISSANIKLPTRVTRRRSSRRTKRILRVFTVIRMVSLL